jgi:progressive ankylosis protein
VLIRSGRTRLVAYGTVVRLVTMASAALGLYAYGGIPGAWVGAAALSVGVCAEAGAARVMAAGAVRTLLADGISPRRPGGAPAAEGGAEAGAGAEGVASLEAVPARPLDADSGDPAPVRSHGEIARFYVPLALTSLIGLSVHPMLTFFMGRATAPVESLAVFPVIHALSFIFRAPGFSFQEVVVALVGRRLEHVRKLATFGAGLALAASGGLALVAFTPLAAVWFETVSGLPPELSTLAVTPTRILVLLPAVAVLLAYQHGLLVQARTTRAITVATALELAAIGVLFTLFGWRLGWLGVTAASLSLVGGRFLGAGYLAWPVWRALAAARSRGALSAGVARW